MRSDKTKKMVAAAAIAAIYSAVSLALSFLSFGALQIRIAESLSLLAVFGNVGVAGVTLGCMITNAIGVAMGTNIAGAADIFIGSAATLLAALLSQKLGGFRIKGFPILSAVPPIAVNALIIGIELCFVTTGKIFSKALPFFLIDVAIGQTTPCLLLGPVLVAALERRGIDRQFFK